MRKNWPCVKQTLPLQLCPKSKADSRICDTQLHRGLALSAFCLYFTLALGACSTRTLQADESSLATTADRISHSHVQDNAGSIEVVREQEDHSSGGLFPPAGPVDNQTAITTWLPQSELESQGKQSLSQIKIKQFDCSNTRLIPTHPQQTTKIYHRYLFGQFNVQKLTRMDHACRIGRPNTGSRLQSSHSCLVAEEAEDVIISDLYDDHCGHTYRGFWHVSLLRKNETMASLSALGRTLYEDHQAGYPGAYAVGDTYELQQNNFVFLAEPFSTDLEKIKINQTQAATTHSRDPKTLLYTIGIRPKN